MRLIDTWIHHDRPMKIERMKSNDDFSSRAMWQNLDASSLIGQTRLNDVNLSKGV